MRYFCTYFDINYMTRGLALYASLKRHCAEFHLDILCLDEECRKALARLSMPECTLISLGDLEAADPALPAAKEGRTKVEYYFTLTPVFVRHLLQRVPKSDFLTYLDADLYFYASPEAVFGELKNSSIGIISHRFPPDYSHMNMHGIYNVGWISFRNDDRARACNDWWRERCLEWCSDSFEDGRYADQGYLNDWPGRFEGTTVIQHLGANVAPWNVGQYKIAAADSTVTIDGQELIFYHFHALRKVTGGLFDSQLSKYGVNVSRELRDFIYSPYLDELGAQEQKIQSLSAGGSPGASTPVRFELIPRIRESNAGVTAEEETLEDYIYKNLVASEKDRSAKEATIIDLLRQRTERDIQIKYLNSRSLLSYNNFWFRRTIRKYKAKIAHRMVKHCTMKPGVLRQYAPRPMRKEKFPKPTLPAEALPSIAIVTPSYMQGHFLERTMQSVLSQEYPRLAYVVQDGGSRDESPEIIKRHASKLAAWESARDAGQSDAVKKGFLKCDGEIMAWLNSDDMLMPGALRFIGEYFARHPDVDAIYGNRMVIDEHDMEVGRWLLPRHDPEVLKWIDYVPQETLFWRRSLWDKVGGVDTSFRFALDWDLLVKFGNAGAYIVRLPYVLGCFRIHEQQKTSAKMDTHGLEEMARIREGIHGREVDEQELSPHVTRFCYEAAKTVYLHAIGIRA